MKQQKLYKIYFLCYIKTYFGAWPSGKAVVFGTTILGSNPSAPAKKMFKKIKKIIIKTDNFLYKKFGSDKSTKVLQNIKEARIIFDNLNDIGKDDNIRFVGGCVRKSISGENVDDIDLATILEPSEVKENMVDDNYEFEPEEDEILSNLLPKNISTQIFKAMLENSASEQGSRMSAMDSATRNAGELVDKLTINYNRSRQAAITKELIEIISGAESL